MKKGLIFVFSLLMILVVPVYAGEPTDMIKQTTDKIIAIVSDPALKAPEMEKRRRRLIREAIDERFDWEEFSRRSLARYWRQRTPEEKKEFIELYGKLLERTYLDKVEGYSGEKVFYVGEKVEGDYATVDVKVITPENVEIPLQYRMRKNHGRWLVYDIIIEGVSLVNNYRAQFNSIIMRSSYRELVKKLKKKVEKE
jgi:phospholipid transport system substrate-binding protein